MMRSKIMLACLMAGALSVGLAACSDDDSTGNDNNNNNNADLCGNGLINPGEDCDGADLGGATCTSQGMEGDTIACNTDCTFDLSACTGCGNGQIETGEVCDGADLDDQTCADVGSFNGGTLACNATCDGYDTSSCDAGCPVPAQDVTSTIGTSTTTVDTLNESDDFTGSCDDTSAPDVLLSFVAPNAGDYVISTANPGTDYDTLLVAFSDCQDPTGSELDCNDDSDGLQSMLMVTATAGQTIYIAVDGYDGGGTAEVSITPVVCGDGNVVAGIEACDDGNTDDGDGCSSICEWECTDDGQEDDDTEATATALTGAFPVTGGGVLCPADIGPDFDFPVDFYTIDIPAGEALDATISAGTMTDCTQQQLGLQFLDPGLANDLGTSTSDGTNCPSVLGVANPGGTQVVMAVFVTNSTSPPQDYNFTLTTHTIVCGDGLNDPGEDCDDGNMVNGDGCEDDCTVTPMCVRTADNDIGTLVSATAANAVVDLTAQTHDYGELSCVLAEGGADGPDYMYSFTVTTTGTLTIDVDHTGGDVFYGLFADDGSCTEVDCFDIYPDVTGQLTAAVTPGDYRLVVQAFSPAYASSVSVTLTAP